MTLKVSDVASINFFKKTDGVELANLSRAERISISYRAEETTEEFPTCTPLQSFSRGWLLQANLTLPFFAEGPKFGFTS